MALEPRLCFAGLLSGSLPITESVWRYTSAGGPAKAGNGASRPIPFRGHNPALAGVAEEWPLLGFYGAPGQSRTADLLVRRHAVRSYLVDSYACDDPFWGEYVANNGGY